MVDEARFVKWVLEHYVAGTLEASLEECACPDVAEKTCGSLLTGEQVRTLNDALADGAITQEERLKLGFLPQPVVSGIAGEDGTRPGLLKKRTIARRISEIDVEIPRLEAAIERLEKQIKALDHQGYRLDEHIRDQEIRIWYAADTTRSFFDADASLNPLRTQSESIQQARIRISHQIVDLKDKRVALEDERVDLSIWGSASVGDLYDIFFTEGISDAQAKKVLESAVSRFPQETRVGTMLLSVLRRDAQFPKAASYALAHLDLITSEIDRERLFKIITGELAVGENVRKGVLIAVDHKLLDSCIGKASNDALLSMTVLLPSGEERRMAVVREILNRPLLEPLMVRELTALFAPDMSPKVAKFIADGLIRLNSKESRAAINRLFINQKHIAVLEPTFIIANWKDLPDSSWIALHHPDERVLKEGLVYYALHLPSFRIDKGIESLIHLVEETPKGAPKRNAALNALAALETVSDVRYDARNRVRQFLVTCSLKGDAYASALLAQQHSTAPDWGPASKQLNHR